jgi:hypothetical protein
MIAVGIIRTGAASIIEVHYQILNGAVNLLPSSHVQIRYCAALQMSYLHVEVKADKNRNPTMPFREVYLPEYIKELNLYPIRDLMNYLLVHRPKGLNRFLLAGPTGRTGWSNYRANQFGVLVGHRPNDALRKLLQFVDPLVTAAELKDFSTTSLRKTLCQALTDDGWPKDVRSDLGAWTSKKQTIDSYQTTSLRTRLVALASLGQQLGPSYYAKE